MWTAPADDETVKAPAGAWSAPAQDEDMESVPGRLVDALTTRKVDAAPADESPAETIKRLMIDAYSPSGLGLTDQASPAAGHAGVGRFLEEEGKRLGSAVRGAGKNIAEKFAELPGVRQFPRAAGAAGAAGSAAVDMLSDSLTPSSQQNALALEGIVGPAISAERGLWDKVAQKASGLPSRVAEAIKASPDFYGSTEGTPEALDAANKAIQDIINEARAGHIDQATAAREIARQKELGDVEGGVRSIQDVIKKARRGAGDAIQTEKDKLGFKSLPEQAEEIAAKGTPPKMADEDLIRETLGALKPDAPNGPDTIEPLVRLRQAIDDRVKYGVKDINPPSTRMAAILKDLRGKINQRLGGPMEADLETFPMEEGAPRDPSGFGPDASVQNFGAPLRKAETEFSRVAKITDPLTKKFDTVPRGVSSVRQSMGTGLRSLDPELSALNDLAGGKEALEGAEGAAARHLEGEKAFGADLKKFDPLASRFETTPAGVKTVRSGMESGLEDVDPELKAIKDLPKGEQALARMKSEVNRFDADRTEVAPNSTAEMVAQTIGITPQRAAKFLSWHGGTDATLAARFPGLTRASMLVRAAAARGPAALSTAHFLAQQQDDDYRAAMQALQGGDK